MKRFYANPAYRAKRVGKAYYLRHQNGARIRTDRFISAVWEKADGRTAAELKEDLERRVGVSAWLLDAVLHLMTKADLLTTDDPMPAVAQLPVAPVVGPRISIVIVNRDGEEHLKTLLPSLARQDYSNFEVVLVDNGSRDNSIKLVKDYFPDVKAIEPRHDAGFSGGNNLGIEAASGDYLFLLNNDTELADDCLSQLVTAAADKRDMAAIVPKMFLWRLPKFLNAVGNAVWPRGWGSDNYIGYLDIGQFDKTAEVFGACFGAVMISRVALDKVGLLDPKYRFYYEDADWSYRARLQGLKIYFAPGAAVYHKFNASMKSLAPNFKWQLVIGNRLRFAAKNLSKGTWLNFMRNYAKEDIRGALRSLKHRDMGMFLTYSKAWGRFIGNLPNILAARRRIQRGRVVKDAQLFELWPELPPLMDEEGHPIFDVGTVRRIYVHFLAAEDRPAGAVRGGSGSNREAREA